MLLVPNLIINFSLAETTFLIITPYVYIVLFIFPCAFNSYFIPYIYKIFIYRKCL